jgi:hypothetical protein
VARYCLQAYPLAVSVILIFNPEQLNQRGLLSFPGTLPGWLMPIPVSMGGEFGLRQNRQR